MSSYENSLLKLQKAGMTYAGEKKTFVGKVNAEQFFRNPGSILNTYGYYCDSDKTWISFVLEGERGIAIRQRKFSTEEEAVTFLIDLAECREFSDYYHSVMDDFKEREYGKIVIDHLQKKYGYSEMSAAAVLNNLLQIQPIAFEYWYLIQHGQYVPDKFAEHYVGYSAERLQQEFHMTSLEAFEAMIHLKDTPDETLAELKRGKCYD